MTDESASADKTKDKSSDKNDNEDMAEWERRLADGDLPEDFLAVTEPQGASATQPVQESQRQTTHFSSISFELSQETFSQKETLL